ncbi:hypothetical protein NMG60_11001966 [Bertholletia excelsa]
MTSVPQCHSEDYIFPHQFSDFPLPFSFGNSGSAAMWTDSGLPSLDGGSLEDSRLPSFFSNSSIPEWFGVSDMAVPVLSEYGTGACDIAGYQNFELSEYQHHLRQDVGELGEEFNGFGPDVWTAKPLATENWGFPVSQIPASMEEPTAKVGKYSTEERKDRILRYMKKKNQRNFNKTIKYACRKTLADKRVRVRGRFARNNELCDEEALKKKHNIPEGGRGFRSEDVLKMEHDSEDWLQEAMQSLMYYPYLSREL